MRLTLLAAAFALSTSAAAACPGGFFAFGDQCLTLDSMTSDSRGADSLGGTYETDPATGMQYAEDGTRTHPTWLYLGAYGSEHFDMYGRPVASADVHGWDAAGNYYNVPGDGMPMDIFDFNDDGVHTTEELYADTATAQAAYDAASTAYYEAHPEETIAP